MHPVKPTNLFLAFLIFLLATPAWSQPTITLSDEATISLITMYPGDAIHEHWGHSGLRVRDSVHGFDLLYNYGTFQFEGMFLPKFIYGKLDYMLWVSDYRRSLQVYRNANRSVIEQTLALDHEQRQATFNFLQYNAQKENRTYRYDFLFDNCSTRIRDVFERTLGDSLRYDKPPEASPTFRALLKPYVADQPFLDLGIDLALSMPIDRQASHREAMFLPLYFMEAYENASIITENTTKPLVARTDTVYWSDSPPESSTRWPFLALMWSMLAISLWVTNGKSGAARKVRKWFDHILFGFGGLVGLLAFFLWFIAIHSVTNYNWNLLWAWPTHLMLLFAFSKRPDWLPNYMRVYTMVVFITILGWYFWPQNMNSALIPVLLAFMIRSAWWGWRQPSEKKTIAIAIDPA